MNLQSGKVIPVVLNSNRPVVFLWADVFGLDKNDKIQFVLKDSKGNNLVNKSFVFEKSNVRRFFTLKHAGSLKQGSYKAEVVLHKPENDFTYIKTIIFKVL